MEIINVDDKTEWEKTIADLPGINFLQSFFWGEFQKELGNRAIRLKAAENGEIAAVQFYLVSSKFSKFIYCPRGPLLNSEKIAEKTIEQIILSAKELKAGFILIEPLNNFLTTILKEKGFSIENKTIQPKLTSILSLEKAEEELMSNLRKTTRQMINKAKNNNIIIEKYNDLSKWNDFEKILTETAQRQKFTAHSLNYLKKQFSVFAEDKKIQLYFAKRESEILAGAIILSYHKTSIYLHAASNKDGREQGAAHFVVWQAILDAKNNGDKNFDFWGIAPQDQPNHPWEGITIFKTGFGGIAVEYPGAFILPINKFSYGSYKLINFLRTFPLLKAAHLSLSRAITKG